MNKSNIILLLLITFTSNLFSQTKIIEDSLLFKLAESKPDTDKVFLLLKLAKFYSEDDIARAQEFNKQALKLSEEINFDFGEAKANYYLAKIIKSYDTDIAQEYLVKSLEIAQDLNDSALIAECYNVIGIIMSQKQQPDDAINYYKKSLSIQLQLKDSALIAQAYNNIGVVYGHLKNDSLALEYFLKAAKLNEAYSNFQWSATNYLNIGRLSFILGATDKAFEYYKTAEKLILKYKFYSLLPWLCNNYSFSYLELGDYDKALFFADSSYRFSEVMKMNPTKQSALDLLKETYKNMGDINKAFEYQTKLRELQEIMYAQEKDDKIKLVEMRFNFEKEQSLNELNNRNRIYKLWLAITGLFVGVLLLYILLRLQTIKTKSSKLEKDLLALEKQNLNSELGQKNRELTSKIISLNDKSEIINQIITSLTNSELNFKKENQVYINNLVSSLKTHQKNDIWEEFEKTFITIHPDFYKNLQSSFPSLTGKELRLCSFLKLNMTSKEISVLMHVNINSVETARARLRKKLNITGSDISLYSFISNY